MRELIGLRRAGEHALRQLAPSGALRVLADALTEDPLPPSTSDEAIDATILFVDIEGFSDHVARTGDDAASRVLDLLDRAVADAIAGTSCRVVKRLGDGVMVATEDPGDGVSAAAAMPRRFAELVAAEGVGLRLRAGSHRGVVRRRGDDLIGYHVNVAARVAERASGGATLITGALRDSVQLAPALRADPAGRLVAKGVPERPRLYEIVHVAPAAT
ncbi:adenylate/guanylate cyclase domain-containing protein [Euzebya sp.]|uniref:adenylate/guanylate cyclase domain-containing protein n=1 Tax=Euzebya sp. TaxID=1971409 RepID=UPI0035174772